MIYKKYIIYLQLKSSFSMLCERDNNLYRWGTHCTSSPFQDKFRECSVSFFLSPLIRAFQVSELYREFQDKSRCVKIWEYESRLCKFSEHVSSRWLSDRLTLSKPWLSDNAVAMYSKPSFPMWQLLRSSVFRIAFVDIASHNLLAPFAPIWQPDSDRLVITLFLSNKLFRCLHTSGDSLLPYDEIIVN